MSFVNGIYRDVMAVVIVNKIVILSFMAFSLSSCVSFIPSFDEALYKHLEEVDGDIDKIYSATSKVYLQPQPFSKFESYYIDAVANVDAAIEISEGRAAYLGKKIAGEPARKLTAALKNCEAALIDQMNAHRKSPLNKQTLEVFAAKDACSIAKVMESRLKKGV